MKYKILFFALLSFCSVTSYAGINAANGFYVGGNAAVIVNWLYFMGFSHNNFMKVRPFVGYHINDYFAVEGGYLDLINRHDMGGDRIRTFIGKDIITGHNHCRLYSIDFAAKVIYPFSNGLSLYGKAGFAFVHDSVFYQAYTNVAPDEDSHTNKISPLVGVGISYNFTQHFATNLELMHIQGSASTQNIDSVGLGLSYTF